MSNLLSTWNIQNREQTTSGEPRVAINLDSSKNGQNYKDDGSVFGICHFITHTKLDVEFNDSRTSQLNGLVKNVHREKPNVLRVLDILLPQLPSPEEIRQQLGYGPLPMEIPAHSTFSTVYQPIKRETPEQGQRYFTIVPSSEPTEILDVSRVVLDFWPFSSSFRENMSQNIGCLLLTIMYLCEYN